MARNVHEMNLNGFRAALGDFARSFMFKMDVPLWGDSKLLSVMARTATLPAFKLKSEQIAFQGLKMNVVSVAEFDSTWQVKMLADENQVLRGHIMEWISLAYDAGTMEASTLSVYKKDDVTVSQVNRIGETISVYKFYGLYPESISSPTFSHDDTSPQTFDVTFKYDFFTFTLGPAAHTMNQDNVIAAVSAPGNNVGASKEAARQKDIPPAARFPN